MTILHIEEAGPVTSEELAERTGTTERYVREWLASQAAGGYASYDAATGRFFLTEEQAFALTDENGPVFLPGAFQLALSAVKSEPRIAEAFKTGVSYYAVSEYHALVDCSGKQPVFKKEAVKKNF